MYFVSYCIIVCIFLSLVNPKKILLYRMLQLYHLSFSLLVAEFDV